MSCTFSRHENMNIHVLKLRLLQFAIAGYRGALIPDFGVDVIGAVAGASGVVMLLKPGKASTLKFPCT